MWCLHAESQVCMYAARGPPGLSSCQGLRGRADKGGVARGRRWTQVTAGLSGPLRLAGSAPPPASWERERTGFFSPSLLWAGEMSRYETEGVLRTVIGRRASAYPLFPLGGSARRYCPLCSSDLAPNLDSEVSLCERSVGGIESNTAPTIESIDFLSVAF